jgi:hypothetical protein
MNKVMLDDELRAKLQLDNGGADLSDVDGNVVAHVLPREEYMRLMYDLAWAEFSTAESLVVQEASEEAYRRGECISSQQLFAEIDALVRRRAAS